MEQQLQRWLLPELVPLVREYVGGFYHAGTPWPSLHTLPCCAAGSRLLVMSSLSSTFHVLEATTLATQHLYQPPKSLLMWSWSLCVHNQTDVKVRADHTYVYWLLPTKELWITDWHGHLVAGGRDWWGSDTLVIDFCLAPEQLFLRFRVRSLNQDKLGVWHLGQNRWLWQQSYPRYRHSWNCQMLANETSLVLWRRIRPCQLTVFDGRTGHAQRPLRWRDTPSNSAARVGWAHGEYYFAYAEEMVVKDTRGVTVRRFPLPPHHDVLVQEDGLLMLTYGSGWYDTLWHRALPGQLRP